MIGKTLAQYEIAELLGKGGMGEVYRARDTKLGREVAIKILPREMSEDPERVARFQREARTLASLQHPNVASIYGLEEVDGIRFLAMEFVEGTDLAARLAAGPISEEIAVEIFRDVALGLAEAHRRGIVHRDLKPANIMLTPEGDVKILDFGLARAAVDDSEDGGDPAMSPTITAAMTQAGTILGTAAYMSPEQARGRRVDHRADIWALGVVLFEMLAGHRLFQGETTTDVLASVITKDVDLDQLPPSTSPGVRRILDRCLRRDPRNRLDSAADAVLDLEDAGPGAPAGGRARRPILPWALAGILLIALGASWLRPTSGPEPVPPRQYELQMPREVLPRGSYRSVVSPDGRWVATSLQDSLGRPRIYLRSLETGEQRVVGNDVQGDFPFWSPDSRYLGFFENDRMRKLHLETGTVQLISSATTGFARGGTWSADGIVLFSPSTNEGLWRVDDDGEGELEVTTVDSFLVDGSHRWPQFLPDGRRFIYTQWSNVLDERAEHGGIFLGSLDGDEPRRLLRDVSAGVLVPTGQLLFHRNDRLMAVDFDLDDGTVSGEPRLASEVVSFEATNGLLGASANDEGDLFVSVHNPVQDMELGWMERNGSLGETVERELPLAFGLALAPDDRYYALELLDEVGSVEIWIGDIQRETLARLSRFDNDCWGASFSPDGREVLYGVQVATGGILYRHEISGARDAVEVLNVSFLQAFPEPGSWFASDRVLVDRIMPGANARGILELDLTEQELRPVLTSGFDQYGPALSPDGRWLAYISTESGRPEIYVRSWPDLEQKWQVSRQGGIEPHWNRGGDEILFRSVAQREMRSASFAVEDGAPRLGLPETVTVLPVDVVDVVPTSDHQRYLVAFGKSAPELPPTKVLVGWGSAKETR